MIEFYYILSPHNSIIRARKDGKPHLCFKRGYWYCCGSKYSTIYSIRYGKTPQQAYDRYDGYIEGLV